MDSFANKLLNKEEVTDTIASYKCDRCSKSHDTFFIQMKSFQHKDKFICSYMCSKDMHLDYGKDYWTNVVNLEDFQHLAPIHNIKQTKEKFSVEYDPIDSDRNEFVQSLIEEDERVEKLIEGFNNESSSDSE